MSVRLLSFYFGGSKLVRYLAKIEHTPGPWLLRISVITWAHFQKRAQISSLCDFHYISERIPSLMSFWSLMTLVLRIWFMQIFARPKKLHEPRTGCSQQPKPHFWFPPKIDSESKNVCNFRVDIQTIWNQPIQVMEPFFISKYSAWT